MCIFCVFLKGGTGAEHVFKFWHFPSFSNQFSIMFAFFYHCHAFHDFPLIFSYHMIFIISIILIIFITFLTLPSFCWLLGFLASWLSGFFVSGSVVSRFLYRPEVLVVLVIVVVVVVGISKGGLCKSFCLQMRVAAPLPSPPAFVTAIHTCHCHRFKSSYYFP